MNCEKVEEESGNAVESVYRVCHADAGISGENGKDTILLKAGIGYGGIASLAATNQCKAKGDRIHPGRPWSVWRDGLDKAPG